MRDTHRVMLEKDYCQILKKYGAPFKIKEN